MSSICLKQNIHTGVTLLKNTFIDNYMINANGEYVKIYLYLLRCMGEPALKAALSTSHFADVFDCTEKDILRALKYWENAGLLSLEFSDHTLTAIQLNEIPSVTRDSAQEMSATSAQASDFTQKSPAVSKERLTELINCSEMKELFGIAQAYMGKTLNVTEMNTIIYFYDPLNFSADLIEYLVEYCATNNHKEFHYIEKVALAWHEAGITTRSQAKEYVNSFSNTYFSILKAFGISGRVPAQAEQDFISKWTNQYGFSLDMILEACNRTINTIHQPSFKYADSILKRWKENDVKSMADLHRLDSVHEKRKETQNASNRQSPPVKKTAFTNFPQREYDFNELEKALLKKHT